jgi:hypothetical protein
VGQPAPQGGAAKRFLTSAVAAIKEPVAGAYHTLVDAPATPEEMGVEAGGGRTALVTKRMLIDPTVAEARRAAEEARQGDWLNQHPRLEAARNELYFDWQEYTTPNGQTVLRPVGPRSMRLSPYDALEFKRMIGDRVRWTQDPLDGAVNEALGASYAKVKDSLNSAVPELKKLNQQYAGLVGAASAIARRTPVAERNAHWSLSEIVLGSSGHIPLAAAVKAARFPRVRTRVAKGLYSLPGWFPRVRKQGLLRLHLLSARRRVRGSG